MSTIKSKVSIQIAGQQPDFVQADHPDFLAFLKAYYEFLESAELQLTTLGSVDSILLEASAGANSLVLQESLNRYRTGEIDTVLLEDTTYGAFINGETITGQTSKATAVIRVQDINLNSRLFISSQNNFNKVLLMAHYLETMQSIMENRFAKNFLMVAKYPFCFNKIKLILALLLPKFLLRKIKNY